MKRSMIVALALSSACVTDPKLFGATAGEDGTSSAGTDGFWDCVSTCVPPAIELDGLPIGGAFDDEGNLLLVRHSPDSIREIIRVSVGGTIDRVRGENGGGDELVFTGEIAVTEQIEGHRSQLHVYSPADGRQVWNYGPFPGWIGVGGTRAIVDGGVQIARYEFDPSRVSVDVVDADGLRATWSIDLDTVSGVVAIAGAAQPADPDDEVVVWLDPAPDDDAPRDATVIRLDADANEIARTDISLGGDEVRPPVPSGAGWWLVGSNDAGVWHQALDAGLAPLGPRVNDSDVPDGGVVTQLAAVDGGFVVVYQLIHTSDVHVRRYDASGDLVGSDLLPPLRDDSVGRSVFGVRANEATGTLALWGFDAFIGQNEGWVRFLPQ